MTRRRRPASPLHPAFAWGNLALQAAEMMAASMQVIAHRSSRRNTPAQVFTMGSEKMLAAMESSQRMARSLIVAAPADAAALWAAWPQVLSAGMAPFRTRARRNARRVSRR